MKKTFLTLIFVVSLFLTGSIARAEEQKEKSPRSQYTTKKHLDLRKNLTGLAIILSLLKSGRGTVSIPSHSHLSLAFLEQNNREQSTEQSKELKETRVAQVNPVSFKTSTLLEAK